MIRGKKPSHISAFLSDQNRDILSFWERKIIMLFASSEPGLAQGWQHLLSANVAIFLVELEQVCLVQNFFLYFSWFTLHICNGGLVIWEHQCISYGLWRLGFFSRSWLFPTSKLSQVRQWSQVFLSLMMFVNCHKMTLVCMHSVLFYKKILHS